MVPDALERKLYIIRKRASHNIQALKLQHGKEYFVPSMSTRTVVYKGLLLADQVGSLLPRPAPTRASVSAIALVHQRFSTNTFPSWELAHPYRMVAHNGEINTVKGNFNWMRAREGVMASPVLGDDLKKLWPLIYEGQSDTACFDNCLELLTMAGYSLPHAMMMMIPEAWEQHTLMDDTRRAFYEYHAAMMEPWDGPAAIAFTDGVRIGATLDRNGLRPARYIVTDDDLVVMASEIGVLPIADSRIVKKWRLQPGKMFLIDTEQARIIDDAELKTQLAASKPYKEWIKRIRIRLDDLAAQGKSGSAARLDVALLDRQQAFGYTQEDVRLLMEPMALAGEEAIGSMGNDAALAVLSSRSKVFYNYFKQLFAQVTNPPIDPIREQLVMSLVSFIGPKPNLLDINNINPPMRLEVAQPILDFADMAKIRSIEQLRVRQVPQRRARHLLSARVGQGGCRGAPGLALRRCGRRRAQRAQHPDPHRSHARCRLGRHPGAAGNERDPPAPDGGRPAHIDRTGRGDRLGARSASLRAAGRLWRRGDPSVPGDGNAACAARLAADGKPDEAAGKTAIKNYIKAIGKGLQKVMSKMGISTYMSYCGAQIFEAVGLNRTLIDKYFRGTASNVGGIGLFEVMEEAVRMHRAAFSADPVLADDAGRRRRVPVARARRRAHVDAGCDRQAAASPRAPTATRRTRSTRRSSTTSRGAT